MRDLLTNANFPRTEDLRVYHLGVRPGEVANRIVTVGSPSRAEAIAASLDDKPKRFVLSSKRGFLTITGRYKGVPVSIVSIGMGSSNMDFFVRETRESVHGDLVIIRLGSCGGLADIPVSSVVVPGLCVQINRNVDFDFARPDDDDDLLAYRISKPVSADAELAAQLLRTLEAAKPPSAKSPILGGTTNASTDSFYSSQGRQTSFYDHNVDLLDRLQNTISNLSTLEMETFHLYHLAACWTGKAKLLGRGAPPLATGPVNPILVGSSASTQQIRLPNIPGPSVIRAAAAHLVFASRTSQDFITPKDVMELERWTGEGVLNALIKTKISGDVSALPGANKVEHGELCKLQKLHAEEGSVWEPV